MNAPRLDGATRFRPGARVRVGTGDPPGHIRTPMYLRGKEGEVIRTCGAYRNPERLAFGGDGLPRLPLYVVSFRQSDVWPNYAGPAHRHRHGRYLRALAGASRRQRRLRRMR